MHGAVDQGEAQSLGVDPTGPAGGRARSALIDTYRVGSSASKPEVFDTPDHLCELMLELGAIGVANRCSGGAGMQTGKTRRKIQHGDYL
jgi:hypothetical protein